MVNVFVVAISFVRSILLARWLPVDVFGIYAGANALIGLTIILTNFGLGPAFRHRAPETEDELSAANVLFSLKLVFTFFWMIGVSGCALLLTSGEQQLAIILLAIVRGIMSVAMTASIVLVRRVVHRRLALIQLADVLLSTTVALTLAWNGWTIGALLATDIASLLLYLLGMYAWRPVWKPRISWNRKIARYYLCFGSRNLLAEALVPALDKIDDLWTAVYLGQVATGYYSRAYAFATYPRTIVARPVNQVSGGTFAELKNDRLRLSKAFFRTNALLIRAGFIVAGILAVTAPELIVILLGEKWLPMLTAFRLMLFFTLLDPIKQNVAELFLALGQPDLVARARLIQLGVLLAGLFVLGTRFGIAGVALAVDLMLVVGIGILVFQAKKTVDFSVKTLFFVPTIALCLGLLLAHGFLTWSGPTTELAALLLKITIFAGVYVTLLALFERKEMIDMVKRIRDARKTL